MMRLLVPATLLAMVLSSCFSKAKQGENASRPEDTCSSSRRSSPAPGQSPAAWSGKVPDTAWAGKVPDDSGLPVQERLVRACISGNLALAERMIASGAAPSALDSLHRTPLMYAARFGRRDIVGYLSAQKADVNASRGIPGLGWSSDRPPYLDLEGGTALMDCAMQGDTGIARILIGNGADIHAKSSLGNTALFYAAQAGHLPMVELLLEKSADPNMVNRINETALSYAVRSGKADVVKTLLAAKSRPNAFTLATALYAAADSDDLCQARRLLGRGYFEDTAFARASFRGSPLIRASQLGRRGFVGLLLENGADPNLKIGYYDPLTAAIRAGNPEMVRFLLENGAKPGRSGGIPYELLSDAGNSGSAELYQELLRHGDSLAFKKHLLTLKHPTGLDPGLFEFRLRIALQNTDSISPFGSLEADFRAAFSPEAGAALKTIQNLNIALRYGMPFDFDTLGITRLMALAVAGDTAAMKLEIGEDSPRNMLREVRISASTRDDMTALNYAILANQLDAVKLLVECGAEVNPSLPRDSRNFLLPLEYAFPTGNRELVEYLIRKGARLRTRSISKNAIGRYYYRIFEYARSKGAYDLPLLIAYGNAGYSDHLYRLVARKDTSVSSQDYQLALVIACVKGNQEIAEFLLEHVPDLAESLTRHDSGRPQTAGDYAFYCASTFNRFSILKLLNRTVRETADWKPPLFDCLRVAEGYGNRESAEYLMQLAFGVKEYP